MHKKWGRVDLRGRSAFVVRIFCILLLLFELRLKRTDGFVKRYFGFMYDYVGRTAFLILYVGHGALLCFE